jgi:ATP-dependent Lon protease
MRDFRDAKAMAQTLRESLTTKAITISHSESLELASRMLGVADWNTLSALLQANRRDTIAPAARPHGAIGTYPAMPIRDFVPFPAALLPLFVGREKTVRAVSQAFEGRREMVLAIQRQAGIDEPRFEDVYEIGVLAQLLELQPQADGTVTVLTRGLRRVIIRRFAMETGAFEAEAAEISEGPITDATELVRKVVARYEDYAAVHGLLGPEVGLLSDQTREPGRIADLVAARMNLPVRHKYDLLATLDPVARLQRIDALLDLSPRPTSPTFEETRRRALGFADKRHHQYATLEHLLLALLDDPDASAVLRACNADLGEMKRKLTTYLDDELKRIVIEGGGSAQPTSAFQRVEQRALLHAQVMGYPAVTGTNALFGIFPESQSPAARLLGEHGVSRGRATRFIVRGPDKQAG